ncbi:MAG: DUF6089 family protein [Bacteroidota bacterium]|jgi:hypothetical protein
MINKHFKFTLLGLFTFFLAHAQYNIDFGGSVGASNYLGDIGGKENIRRDFLADMKMAKTRFAITGFYRYRFRDKFYIKGEMSFIRIAGDDALTTNPGRRYRNFNFTNNIVEMAGTIQWQFAENTDLGGSYRFRNALRFYAFTGAALLYHNPKTLSDGKKVAVRKLKTEGQSKPYSPVTFAIPVGLGMHYSHGKRHRFGFELNWRTVFTDYLDDIHSFYPDPSKISTETAQVVYSTNINEAEAFAPGFSGNYDGLSWDSNNDGVPDSPDKRGDNNHNDSYLTATFSYSYIIRGKSNFLRARYGNYFRKKGRRVVRRIRSKF